MISRQQKKQADEELRERLYQLHRAENMPSRQKAYEIFDKSVLTLSGSGLALSLTFIHDIVPLDHLSFIFILVISWSFFGLAIFSILYSIRVAPQAIDEDDERSRRYYKERDETALNEKGPHEITVKVLNIISWWSFFIAVVLTVLFVTLNLISYKGDLMTENSKGKETQKSVPHFDGAEPTKMQRISNAIEATNIQKIQGVKSGEEKAQGNSGASSENNQNSSK